MGDRPVDSNPSRAERSHAEPSGSLRMLVAGMHGFIGTHIAHAAQSDGIDVVGMSLDRDIKKAQRFHESIGLDSVSSIAGDATDVEAIWGAIDRYEPDIFVNAVGVIGAGSTTRWITDYEVNYATAAASVEAIAKTDRKRRPFTVWIGSQAEYGDAAPPWIETTRELPSSGYGTSKQVASALIMSGQRAGLLDACVVRLPIVFGPGQEPNLFVAKAIQSALGGQRLPMTAGEQRRRFTYAPDVGSSVVALGRQGISNSAPTLVNAPGYEPVEIRQVVQLLKTLLPDIQVDLGALQYRSGEQMEGWPDCSLAEAIGLGVATPFELALSKTVSWYQDNLWFTQDFAS